MLLFYLIGGFDDEFGSFALFGLEFDDAMMRFYDAFANWQAESLAL